MSDDPVRWKDATDPADAPKAARALLRREGPVPKMPAALRAALVTQLALPPATAPPATAPPAAALGGTAGLLVAAGVGAVVIAAIVWASRATPRPDPPSASAAPSASAPASAPASASPSAAASAAPTPASALASASSAPPSAFAPRSAHPTASAPSGASASADPLSEESAIVTRARAASASNPALTLALVDEHAKRFPRGELTQEREYLRISALRRLGRTDEARARARSYLTTFPSSPYAPAVRSLLTDLGPP